MVVYSITFSGRDNYNKPMKILIISRVAWRDDINGGNVLSNIFKGFNAEFAMISCSSIEPNNEFCKHYYQLTDKMMVDNVFHGVSVGRYLEFSDYPSAESSKESYSGAKGVVSGDILRLLREIVWKMADWNEISLFEFVDNFKPDVIYAPCQGLHYMIRLVRLVAEHTKVPVISYISDDFYSYNKSALSPIYWVNQVFLRKHVRNIFKYYRLCYTMTDEQKELCEKEFNANMKILRKSGVFDGNRKKEIVNKPIKLVYAGNLLYNRYKTLIDLINAIKKINRDAIRMELDIYSTTVLREEVNSILNDGVNSRLHGAVSMDELRSIYGESDIALHVEGFDKKSSKAVRMSFSTKIIDCMDSGCAVMAICDEKQAGGAYLRRNDCAICVNNLDDIYTVLKQIVNNPDIIISYQHKAFEVGRINHLQENISKGLNEDFMKIAKN